MEKEYLKYKNKFKDAVSVDEAWNLTFGKFNLRPWSHEAVVGLSKLITMVPAGPQNLDPLFENSKILVNWLAVDGEVDKEIFDKLINDFSEEKYFTINAEKSPAIDLLSIAGILNNVMRLNIFYNHFVEPILNVGEYSLHKSSIKDYVLIFTYRSVIDRYPYWIGIGYKNKKFVAEILGTIYGSQNIEKIINEILPRIPVRR